MHRCGKCGAEQPDDAFYRDPSGRPHSPCKSCRRAYRPPRVSVSEKRCSVCATTKAAREFRPDVRKTTGLKSACRDCERQWRPQSVVIPAEKRCTACEVVKPSGEFYRDPRNADGLYGRCKPCHNRLAYPGQKAYKATNQERVRAWNQRWCAEHRSSPEQRAEQIAKLVAWNAAHPSHKAIREQRRRARKAGTVNDFTAAQWEALKVAYGHRCAYCGKRSKLTMDHVIPLSKGGEHTARNIVPACGPCNTRKLNRDAPTHQRSLLP